MRCCGSQTDLSFVDEVLGELVPIPGWRRRRAMVHREVALCTGSSSLSCTVMTRTTYIQLSGFVPYIRFHEEVKKNSPLLRGQGVRLLEVDVVATKSLFKITSWKTMSRSKSLRRRRGVAQNPGVVEPEHLG